MVRLVHHLDVGAGQRTDGIAVGLGHLECGRGRPGRLPVGPLLDGLVHHLDVCARQGADGVPVPRPVVGLGQRRVGLAAVLPLVAVVVLLDDLVDRVDERPRPHVLVEAVERAAETLLLGQLRGVTRQDHGLLPLVIARHALPGGDRPGGPGPADQEAGQVRLRPAVEREASLQLNLLGLAILAVDATAGNAAAGSGGEDAARRRGLAGPGAARGRLGLVVARVGLPRGGGGPAEDAEGRVLPERGRGRELGVGRWSGRCDLHSSYSNLTPPASRASRSTVFRLDPN